MMDPAPAIRRNGLLQSCEPCRKSKLKCDHGRPICGRCIAKSITQRCFYHPAPMTKVDVGNGHAQNQSKRRRTDSSTSSTPPPSTAPSIQYTRPDQPSVTPGYLGSTSFSAVFSEHRTDIALEEDSALSSGALAKSHDRLRLESGLEVLKFLYRSPICDILIRRFYDGHLGAAVSWILMESVLISIQKTFESLERGRNLETQLRELVLRVFRSSAHPLTSHAAMTVEEYCASFTGPNLRWEVIGLVLATAGIALSSTADTDAELVKAAPDAAAREMLRAQVVEGSNIVLGFCDTSASVNELLGFYQYNDMLLKTQHYGDTSYVAWRRLGDLTATVYAAGLHQESTRGTDCPPFLHQWRKMCFGAAFYADKCLSTFVGRPPFLNYRYCSISPPLDLTDQELIQGGEKLNDAIAGLDATGWNPRGSTLRVSMLRLRFLLAVLREKALEIALGLGGYDEGDILGQYNKVLLSAHSTWTTCPATLRFDSTPTSATESRSFSWSKRHIYLDYLYTLFLVQRMVVKRTNTGHEDLFRTSRSALAIILELSGERHPGEDMSRHHSWVVLYYGLPAASVLAFELLRQTNEPGPHPSLPPRAELIRNLSVFVSCLSWVASPGQGNYRTCKAVEKKLSDILDQILDPKPMAEAQAQMQGLGLPQTGYLGLGMEEDLGGLNGLDMAGGLYSLMNWYEPEQWEFESLEGTAGGGGSKEGFSF
ncbi:hypothetical protein BJY04DRAFT_168101 [Aspergillus karnatakaensis]|uniref:putative C6 transcription factor n=1 Tax=Aspergillus karnatakaensis TaxID=1810916 RepID=UPI003CCDDF40